MIYLYELVGLLFQIFIYMILVEVIASWILAAGMRLPAAAYSILAAVHRLTAPLLGPLRRLIPPIGGFDLTPIIAVVLLEAIRNMILNAMRGSF